MSLLQSKLHPQRGARLLLGSVIILGFSGACLQFSKLYRPVPGTICHSEEIWTYQDKDSPLMNPGRSCVECHATTTEAVHAPHFKIAGTVMHDLREADDCRGAASQTLVLIDAQGVEHEIPTNSAGNFWLLPEVDFTMPLLAKIVDRDGNERVKKVPVESGDCASCHTKDGKNGAPGRLTPPEVSQGAGGAR